VAEHLLEIASKHLRTIAFVIALGLIAAAPPPTEAHAHGAAGSQPKATLMTR
jgi:hypothetical protein